MLENTAVGDHLAEVFNNRTLLTDAQQINVEIEFVFPSGDRGFKTLYFHTQKGIEQSAKTLSILGFRLKTESTPDGRPIGELEDGSLMSKKAMVTVELNEYPPGSGKVKKQIAWVNRAKLKPTKEAIAALQDKLSKTKLSKEAAQKEDEFA